MLILEISSGSKCKPPPAPAPPTTPSPRSHGSLLHQHTAPYSISTLPPIPSQGSQTSSGVDVQGKEGIVGRKIGAEEAHQHLPAEQVE